MSLFFCYDVKHTKTNKKQQKTKQKNKKTNKQKQFNESVIRKLWLKRGMYLLKLMINYFNRGSVITYMVVIECFLQK